MCGLIGEFQCLIIQSKGDFQCLDDMMKIGSNPERCVTCRAVEATWLVDSVVVVKNTVLVYNI